MLAFNRVLGFCQSPNQATVLQAATVLRNRSDSAVPASCCVLLDDRLKGRRDELLQVERDEQQHVGVKHRAPEHCDAVLRAARLGQQLAEEEAEVLVHT